MQHLRSRVRMFVDTQFMTFMFMIGMALGTEDFLRANRVDLRTLALRMTVKMGMNVTLLLLILKTSTGQGKPP